MKHLFLFLFFILVPFIFGCASNQIIEKSEYQTTAEHLKTENVAMALNKFPKKEKHHFVTLLEKVYLQLLNTDDKSTSHTPEFEMLLAASRAIQENEKTSLSNELDQLFFIKTNEGYYPANHEVFWMHLMLGMTFVKKKQIDKARVEAKRISELFARVDMKGRPFYDNPGIRLLAASLWIMCGEKENALVDLRVLKQGAVPTIMNTDTDPIDWEITFKGIGFYPEMDTSSFANKFIGFKALKFKSTVAEKDLVGNRQTAPVIFSSLQWHEDNLIRNEEFKDTIQKSKYMSRMFKSEFEYQSLNLLTSIAAGTVMVAGITIGVAIVGGGIYLAATSGATGAGDAIMYIGATGFLVGAEVYQQGMKFYDSTQNKIQSERKEYQDASRYYRYVRFIPDYFFLNKKTDALGKNIVPILQTENSSGKIRILFQP